MKKIAVTGATGFIGSHLVKRLRKEGYEVNCLARNQRKGYFKGDLIRGKGLKSFLKGVDIVINLVGGYHPPFESQIQANAVALNNLCEASIQEGVKKVIHISTSAVYGSKTSRKLFTEKDKTNPDTLYGLSKHISEVVASYYYRNYGLKFIILRPSNVYGPGNEDGVIYRFAKSVKESGRFEIYGDGKNMRDYLFIEDMVEVILRAIKLKSSFEVLNVGLGKVYSLLDVVEIFQEVLGEKIRLKLKKETVKTSKLIASNTEKAKRLLKWQPKYSLKEGIKVTIDEIF